MNFSPVNWWHGGEGKQQWQYGNRQSLQQYAQSNNFATKGIVLRNDLQLSACYLIVILSIAYSLSCGNGSTKISTATYR